MVGVGLCGVKESLRVAYPRSDGVGRRLRAALYLGVGGEGAYDAKPVWTLSI